MFVLEENTTNNKTVTIVPKNGFKIFFFIILLIKN